jgi:hypothetical protein
MSVTQEELVPSISRQAGIVINDGLVKIASSRSAPNSMVAVDGGSLTIKGELKRRLRRTRRIS